MQVRILFVDDSQDDVELLLARLRSADLSPEWLRVASEGELREALASSEWQVALVDYDLPGFSGLEALHILAHAAPDLPAITVSGTISEETAVATITGGAVDFVLKDNLTRLAPAVKRAVESAELQRLHRNAAEQARLSEFAVDHASQAIVYVSEAGVVLYANRAAGRLAGIAPEAAIGEEIWAWYPHLSREDWSGLWHAATEGPVEDVDALLRRADGSKRAVSITLDHMARDESEFVIAYAHDLTESKRAQADLSFTQFVVEHAGDSVFWMEAEGAFKYANPAACEALGYTLDELLAMSIRDIDPKYSSRWAEHISELKEAGSLTFETHHRRKDGALMPVEVTAAYLEYDGVAYDVGFARDITERKRIEAELERERRDYETIFDSSPVMIVYKSEDDHILKVNDAFARFIGLPKDEIVGMTTFDVADPKETAQLGRDDDLEVIRTGEPRMNRLVFFSSPFSDNNAWVLFSKLPFRDGSGGIAGTVSFVTDVTDRKLAEDALESSAAQLRRTVEGSVLAMGQVVETRDPYTAGHERRVSELAVAIAEEMAVGAADLDGLRMAALIHDVGKVAVPAEILSKPGRLSEVEFNLIKQHAQAGYDILRAIEFQQPVAEMVLQHHERLDGSGYPGGSSAKTPCWNPGSLPWPTSSRR